ncbi:RNA polymerase sigma (SigV) subunit [Nonomuraea fuscirosea]|uniref:RNA polymerase sigma (SigV) subunit n=1 Tax=Nonomuraea fuscirosea TaxID=1291556 RepID=A0A2T0LK60_9ACTN|nr:SigE family RNA polymerase sigma factor [Nonomuraea fuscirosea]PRX43101.1 RNA polymerase sigma (SigV) subunit [Nonomuraea fuscirosea]
MDDGFDSFVVHRYDRLRHSAFLLTGDLGTAEDVVQSALAKAWVAWGRIKSNPDSYVYRIVVNTHISWWRRKWRNELPSVDVPDHPDPHDFTIEVERRQTLLAAIGGLSRRQRAIVVLHYFEQLTLTQCAEVLGCSLGTVKTQLGRALKRLRVDPAIQPAEVER